MKIIIIIAWAHIAIVFQPVAIAGTVIFTAAAIIGIVASFTTNADEYENDDYSCDGGMFDWDH